VAGWVDSHCHLHMSEEPAALLLDRASGAGVEWVVDPGTDAASSAAAIELGRQFPAKVFPAVGLHPHDAERWDAERSEIERMAPQAVAIGECGLDFYRNLSSPDAQIAAFRGQIDLAASLDKPLIVHCRDAFSEVFDLIGGAGAGPRAILHCWTGGPRWTKRFADLGVTFSFAGPVAFETGDTVRRGAAEAPPERTMVETDTPYLSPVPHRGYRNEPAHVALVAGGLAAALALDASVVASQTTGNAAHLFGWKHDDTNRDLL